MDTEGQLYVRNCWNLTYASRLVGQLGSDFKGIEEVPKSHEAGTAEMTLLEELLAQEAATES
jgi:hypothetical protein